MVVSLVKNVFLALLLASITTVHAVPCSEPRIRREWRSISEAEREEWVAAVKVFFVEWSRFFMAAERGLVSQSGAPQVGFDT